MALGVVDMGAYEIPCLAGIHGDIEASGIVDVGDVLCGLGGFTDAAACPTADIALAGGDGFIDVSDILAVLFAYGGPPVCADACDG